MRLYSVLAVIIFLQMACIFDSSEDDLILQRVEKELDFEIASLIDNGHFIEKITLVPRQINPDLFYLIESPDLLDSVFSSISYSGETTPLLENLFPENGMLLIYDGILAGQGILDKYQISAIHNTLYLEFEWAPYEDLPDPCAFSWVFPIGIIPVQ